MNNIDELREIVRRDAVKKGRFILASGKESDLYVDLRKVTLHHKGAFLIGSIIYEIIKDRAIDAIGGMSIGADPIAVASSLIAYQSGKDINAFLVRKEKKAHGTQNLIEGPVITGQRVVVVEDVITTGTSTINAINHIKDAGMEIEMVIAILDRMEGGTQAIESLGFEVFSLLTREDI